MKTFGLYVTSRPRVASLTARASAMSSSSGRPRRSTRRSYVSDAALKREHVGHEQLRLRVDPDLTHGLLALVPGGESQPFVALEVMQEVAQIQNADLDVAVEGGRNPVAEEHVLDELARRGQGLENPAGAYVRDDAGLESRLHPGERTDEVRRDAEPACPGVETVANLCSRRR